MSLKNICFENIKDEFYYGKFGEFTLVIDKSTGFFNATKLCKQSKKQYSHWFRLERTKELIKCLKSRPPHVEGGFSYEKQTSNYKVEKLISGTYICKELILDLASWISPEFYLKCNDIILNYFEREYQSTIKQKDDKIDKLLNEVSEVKNQNNITLEKLTKSEQQNNIILKRLESMGITLEETKEQLDEVQEDLNTAHEVIEDVNTKLDTVLPDRNIDPKQLNLAHQYILFKSKLIDNEYVFIRGQNKHIENIKKLYKTRFEITIDQRKNPNPIDLVNRLKENIKSINKKNYKDIVLNYKATDEYKNLTPVQKRRKIISLQLLNSKISFKINKIILNDFSEESFLELINNLDDEKFTV